MLELQTFEEKLDSGFYSQQTLTEMKANLKTQLNAGMVPKNNRHATQKKVELIDKRLKLLNTGPKPAPTIKDGDMLATTGKAINLDSAPVITRDVDVTDESLCPQVLTS